MEIKGLEQLSTHVPELRTTGGVLRIAGIVAAVITLETLFFISADRSIPDWTPDGQVIFITLGFLLMRQFFTQKKKLQERFGDEAYRHAFGRYVLTGLPLIFGAVAHLGYLPGLEIPRLWWYPILPGLGWLMLIVGAVLWVRAFVTFGIDNITMLYVYFPQEGRLVNSEIYNVIRHPVYAGALRISLGLALLNGNWNALFLVLFLLGGLTVWLAFVEERELIERFGAPYADHRKRVPAFWPRPRDLGKFFRFLLTGK